jgi:hypothetical protein
MSAPSFAGISIHVVDVSRGVVASGMRIEVYATAPERRLLCPDWRVWRRTGLPLGRNRAVHCP